MALKNDETISLLGKRLIDLMVKQKYESPRELAVHLYDQHLVHVKTRTTDNPDYDIRLSAIGSIEKKIVRHIKTGLISDDTGEYLLAYCKTLNCSSDYLLGLTDIHSPDMEIRRMAEKTGLEEDVIANFVRAKNYDITCVSEWWSFILKQNIFLSIPYQLSDAEELMPEQNHIEDILISTMEQIKKCPADDEDRKADLYVDFIEYKERLQQIRPSIQGILYKISRELTDILEEEIKAGFHSYWTPENERDLFSI